MGRNLLYNILKTAGDCKAFVFLGLCLIHAQIHAQTETANQIFENISDKFSVKSPSKDHQFGEFFLLFLAGVVLIFMAWLAYQLYVQRSRNLSPDSAWGVYQKLCQVHNLNFQERLVIRKVFHWNELEDPLPLFVEPNYFKQILADETKARFHGVVRGILDKLFSSKQELSQELQELIEVNKDHSRENRQESPANEEEETAHNVEHRVGHSAADFPPARFEQPPVSSGQEKPSSMPKVLLNPIPGRMAFSSLVEPVHRLTSEIAAESIRNTLSEGRGMNERTYNGIGELRQVLQEPQSPFFPKTSVPSPNEMLANESRRVGQLPAVSPTPQYLRTHKEMSPGVSGKHPSDSRHNPKTTPPKPGEAPTFENMASLETIVTGK